MHSVEKSEQAHFDGEGQGNFARGPPVGFGLRSRRLLSDRGGLRLVHVAVDFCAQLRQWDTHLTKDSC
jgi:hypothetical protein